MADVYRSVCGAVRSDVPLLLPRAAGAPRYELSLGAPETPSETWPAPEHFVEVDDGRFVGILGARLVVTVDLRRRHIDLTPAPGMTDAELEHLVVDHLLPRIADEDGLCLHAAAVRIAGGAVLLVGGTGAGKSTLATELALRGGELIADDCALIRDGRVQSTSRGCRLHPDAVRFFGWDLVPDATGKVLVGEAQGLRFATAGVPVSRIVVVGEHEGTLSVAEAFERLSANRFWLRRPDRRQHLQEMSELLERVPPVAEVDWTAQDLVTQVERLGRAAVR